MKKEEIKKIQQVLASQNKMDLLKQFNAEHVGNKCRNLKCSDCCKYIMIDVTTPDFSYYRYLIYHGLTLQVHPTSVSLFLQINCFQQNEQGCKSYKTRPKICSGYSSETCLRKCEESEIVFTVSTIEELEKYERKIRKVAREVKEPETKKNKGKTK